MSNSHTRQNPTDAHMSSRTLKALRRGREEAADSSAEFSSMLANKPRSNPSKKQTSFDEQWVVVGRDTDRSDASRSVDPAPVGEEPSWTGACRTLSSLHEVQTLSLQVGNSADASMLGRLGTVPLATQGPTQGPPECRMRMTRQRPIAAGRWQRPGRRVNRLFLLTFQLKAMSYATPPL